MPAATLKRLAKKAKVSISKAEAKWNHAKNIVKSEYNISEKDKYFWALVTAITKKMLRLKEEEDTVTFKKFLTEMHYGSLVDQDKYDHLDEADQALYKYTADGFTALDTVIDELIEKYPYDGGTIYRGLHFDTQEQHDSFLEKIKEGKLTMAGPSSWTPSKSTALDFAHSKKTYFPDLDIMKSHQKMRDEGEHMSGYGGVVLKTTVGSGVGCDVSKSDFAKESEVILKPGSYKVDIIELLEPHKRSLNSVDKVRSVISAMGKADSRDKELDSKLEFIVKSWLLKDLLTEKDADIIMKYELMKFLNFSDADLKQKFSSFEINPVIFKKDKTRLKLDVFIPVDDRIFKYCSDKMKEAILKKIRIIGKGAESKIKELINHPEIKNISEFDIGGMDALRHFYPEEADKISGPLRQILAKRYHELNDRDYLKTIKDMDAIRQHGKDVGEIVKAMASI